LQAKDYTSNKAEGRALARGDVPFLFRAFEAGQVRVLCVSRCCCSRQVLDLELNTSLKGRPVTRSDALFLIRACAGLGGAFGFSGLGSRVFWLRLPAWRCRKGAAGLSSI